MKLFQAYQKARRLADRTGRPALVVSVESLDPWSAFANFDAVTPDEFNADRYQGRRWTFEDAIAPAITGGIR